MYIIIGGDRQPGSESQPGGDRQPQNKLKIVTNLVFLSIYYKQF